MTPQARIQPCACHTLSHLLGMNAADWPLHDQEDFRRFVGPAWLIAVHFLDFSLISLPPIVSGALVCKLLMYFATNPPCT
jgi:hypothetical protein